MITIIFALVNKFLLDSDEEIYMGCLLTSVVDGLIAWAFLGDLLIG